MAKRSEQGIVCSSCRLCIYKVSRGWRPLQEGCNHSCQLVSRQYHLPLCHTITYTLGQRYQIPWTVHGLLSIHRCPVGVYLNSPPRTNGLAEHYNACIKAGIHHLCSVLPRAKWYNCIYNVIAGLCFLPARSGYASYLLTFKQCPEWHSE